MLKITINSKGDTSKVLPKKEGQTNTHENGTGLKWIIPSYRCW